MTRDDAKYCVKLLVGMRYYPNLNHPDPVELERQKARAKSIVDAFQEACRDREHGEQVAKLLLETGEEFPTPSNVWTYAARFPLPERQPARGCAECNGRGGNVVVVGDYEGWAVCATCFPERVEAKREAGAVRDGKVLAGGVE